MPSSSQVEGSGTTKVIFLPPALFGSRFDLIASLLERPGPGDAIGSEAVRQFSGRIVDHNVAGTHDIEVARRSVDRSRGARAVGSAISEEEVIHLDVVQPR